MEYGPVDIRDHGCSPVNAAREVRPQGRITEGGVSAARRTIAMSRDARFARSGLEARARTSYSPKRAPSA